MWVFDVTLLIAFLAELTHASFIINTEAQGEFYVRDNGWVSLHSVLRMSRRKPKMETYESIISLNMRPTMTCFVEL